MPGDKENERLQNASPAANTDGDDSVNSYSRPVKKRKATYLVKKEEKARLSQEMQELEAQLAALKERVGFTGVQSIEKVATSNVVLSNVLRQQQLLVTNAYAGLAACVRGPAPNPLYSYIHLGIDLDQRRQVLNAIRDMKLQNGVDYVQARSQHLDLLQPYATSEQFVDAQGNFCCSYFDVVQFTGVKSVREVFDAAMFHFMNEEISISERLGFITVRDDFSVDEDDFSNCRLSSADEGGVRTEVNTASFAQYVDAAQSETGDPFAILVRDSVDVDELYPYSPDKCVRKDQMGSILVTAIRKSPNSEGNHGGEMEEGELVVVMRRAGFVKIHRPAFPVPERTQRGLLKGITSWFEITLASMQSALSASTVS
ncbi:hypothetical protein V7S43_014480 [Phytophthora oleae]|uniref:BZIP domain-containing protein n=1 Tax=Phytophthora oleae TaxID=2107226 RepID=A0ABD3F3U2_9STRA